MLRLGTGNSFCHSVSAPHHPTGAYHNQEKEEHLLHMGRACTHTHRGRSVYPAAATPKGIKRKEEPSNREKQVHCNPQEVVWWL